MFQKTVMDRYLSQQDKDLVAARYAAHQKLFADPDKVAKVEEN